MATVNVRGEHVKYAKSAGYHAYSSMVTNLTPLSRPNSKGMVVTAIEIPGSKQHARLVARHMGLEVLYTFE